MRLPRIKGPDSASSVYHCMSRTVAGQHLLDDLCRHKLTKILFPLAAFCGLEVITFCMMPNHFHLLIRIPPHAVPSDADLLARARILYGPRGLLPTIIRQDILSLGHIRPSLRQSLTARMGDISAFMKEFKQRFSRWFNRRHDRFGTLWAERYKSVLVEDCPQTLRVVASYIDLNQVRAGWVSDPKDYRFCGYAAALAGNRTVRRGLMDCVEASIWEAAAAEYRMGLFVRAGNSGKAGRAELDRESILAELRRGGRLSTAEILRLHIRHFTDGVALGSREFVNTVFAQHRPRFGPRRTSGARPLRSVQLPFLSTLRQLRLRTLE